jgi:hypothetical protein
MKTNYYILSLVLLLGLATSCSRQLTSLTSSSQLKTVSLPASKPILSETAVVANTTPTEPSKALPINAKQTLKAWADANIVSTIKKKPGFNKILKKGAESIVSLALKQSNNLTLLQKNTADKGYPQINKAGFIFVAAGILGYFLKLLLVACLICVAIGLIVLISPLFRKRY